MPCKVNADDERAVLMAAPAAIGPQWDEAVEVALADLGRTVRSYGAKPSPETRLAVARAASWVVTLFTYDGVAVVKVQ